jgi:hypothetical protein
MFFGVFWILYPGKLVNFPLKEWVRTSDDGKFGNILGNAAADSRRREKQGISWIHPSLTRLVSCFLGRGEGGGLSIREWVGWGRAACDLI